MEITVFHGCIVHPFEKVTEGYIKFCGSRIVEVGEGSPPFLEGEKTVSFPGCFISPGFIDTHVHGGGGADFNQGTKESLETAAAFHASGGTASLLATIVPEESDRMIECLSQSARLLDDGLDKGARILGLHLEGPFLNPARRGALDRRFVIKPRLEKLNNFIQASAGYLKMITLAPELEQMEDIIREAAAAGVVVSAGHTEADLYSLKESMGWGLQNVTHLYNAMRGMHHREPGTVGGTLLLQGLRVDLIPDQNHIDPLAFLLAWRQKGPSDISVITDCISAGGMADGQYRLGGKKVFVNNGTARLEDGTLAGSTITMIDGIKFLVEEVGLKLEDAVGVATVNPAALLGIDQQKGLLKQGWDADLTVFDLDYKVRATVVAGRLAYGSIL